MNRVMFSVVVMLITLHTAFGQGMWLRETWSLDLWPDPQPNADEIASLPAHYPLENWSGASLTATYRGEIHFRITPGLPNDNDDEELQMLAGNVAHHTLIADKSEHDTRTEWNNHGQDAAPPWHWVVDNDGVRWPEQWNLNYTHQIDNTRAPQKPQIVWTGWQQNYYGQRVYRNGNSVDGVFFMDIQFLGSAICSPTPIFE